MDTNFSGNPDSPFSQNKTLPELYSNPLIEQFFSVLLNSIGGKDFLILAIGEPQSGKSTFLTKLITEVEDHVKPCELKIRESDDPLSGNNHYPAFLYKTKDSQVIILDDAHDLNRQELSIILKHAWDNNKKTKQLILFCEPAINTSISLLLKEMPKKTSVNKLYIPTYDRNQTESYLKHYLEYHNTSKNFSFSDKNIQNIFDKSQGFPGRINYEADLLFFEKNLKLPKDTKLMQKPRITILITIATLLFLFIGAFFLLKNTGFVSMFSNDVSISKKPVKSITKKIQPEIKTEQNSNNEIPKHNTDIPVEKIIPKTTITEIDIIENQTDPKPIKIAKISNASNVDVVNKVTPPIITPPIISKPKPPTPVKIQGSTSTLQGIGLSQKKWILEQNPEEFTLQIMAAKEKDAVKRFSELDINTQNQIAYYIMNDNGILWYKFIAGKYKSLEQARNARNKLPEKLKKLGPWPRQFSTIQKDINDFTRINTSQ